MFENPGEKKLKRWGGQCPDCEETSEIYVIVKIEKKDKDCVSYSTKYLKCYLCGYEELKENKNRKNKKYEYDFESEV